MFDFDQTKNTKNTNKEKSSSNTKNNNSDNTTANHNIRTQHINTSNGSNGDTLGMGHKNGHENGLGYCNDIQTPPSKSKINLNSKKRSNFIKSSKASSKICPGSALFESSNNNNSASSTTSTSTTGNNHYNHHHSSNRNLNLNRGKRNQQRRPHNTNNTTHTRDPLDAAIDEQGGYNASGNHGGNYRNRGKHSGNYNARSRFSSPMGSYDEKRKGGNNNNSSNNNGSSHSYNSNIPRLKPASTMSHRKRRLGLTMSTKNNRRRSTGAISTSTHASTSTNTGTNTGTNKVTSSSGKLQAAAEEFRDDTTSSFSLNEERFKIPNVSHGHNVSRGHNVSQSVSQSKAHFISQSQPKEKEKTMKKQIEVVLIDDTDTENELDHDINKNGNKNGNDNNSDIDDSNEKKMSNHENAITAKVNDDMNTNTNTNTNMSANTHDITITSRNNSGKTDIDKDIDIDTDIDMSIHHPSKKQKKTDYSKTTTEEVLLQLSSSSSFLSSPQTSTSPPSSLLLHKSSSKSSFMMGNCVQLKQNEHGNEHEHGHGQRQRHDSEHSHDNEHRHRRGKGTFTPQQGHDDIILSSSSSSSSSSSLHTQPGELVKTKDTNDNTDDNTNTNIKSLSSIESANNQSNQDPIEITSPGDNDNDDKQVDDDDDDEVCEIHQFSPHKKHNNNTTERTNEIFTDDDDDFSFFNTMNEINSTPYKKLEDDSSFSSSNNNNNDSSSNITKRITRSPYGSKSRIRKAESKDFEKYNSTLNKSISTSTHLSPKEEKTPIHELGPLPPQPPPSSSMTSSSPSRKLQAIGKSFMENISPTKLLNHCKRKGLNLTKMNNVIDDDIESVSSSAQSNPRGNTSNQRRKFTYGDKLDLMLQPSCPLKKNKKAKSSSSYEKVDESFRGKLGSVIGKTRRSSRLRNVKKQKNDEVIEIDDDDDDYDCSDGSDNESVFNEWGLNDDEQQIELAKKDSLRIQEEQKKKFGARHSVKVKRISIGKIVYSHSCSLAFQPGGAQQHIRLQYAKVQKGQNNDNKEEKEHVITVDDSINTMKYFTTPTMDEKREEDEDKASSSNEDEKKEAMEISSTSSVQKKHLADGLCHMNILVLRVEPNKKNDLLSLSNSYQPEFGKLIDVILKQKDRERRFILIEFNKNTDLQKLLQLMKGNGLLSAMLDTGSISSSEMHKYIESFKKEDDKLKKERIRSNTFRPDEVVLTFPFDATYAELNEAAQDLSEVNGLFNNEETAAKNEEDKKQGTYVTTSESEKFRNVWKHSHTVRGEDFDRLEPGEYLNDTLIDLWMTWILRREDASSNVHFFSTQFFQKIQDQGPQSVVSWTKRRKINIFEKKFIFIPINDYLHWSICVVVNPGKIENAYGDDEVRSGETDAPFLLFLDSLRAHQKNKVKGHIYSWLNLEATRLNLYQNLRTRKNESLPFWPHSMPMFDPVVPYQDNGWDCGVFVCRYALGVLSLRNKRFTFDSSKSYATLKKDMQKMLRNLITEDDGFKFNMDDIARLRDEFAQLIKNLSHMYKQKEIEKKRLKRMKEKEEQCGEQTSNKGGMFV